MLQQALNAATVQEEEALWTQIIDKYGKMEANWVPDLVSCCVAALAKLYSRHVAGLAPSDHMGGLGACAVDGSSIRATNRVHRCGDKKHMALAGGAGVGQPRQCAQPAGPAAGGPVRLQPQHPAVPLERGPGAEQVGGWVGGRVVE